MFGSNRPKKSESCDDEVRFVLPSGLNTFNDKGWGPPKLEVTMFDSLVKRYPFEPEMKNEKLGRVIDFTYNPKWHQANLDESVEYKVVDSRPIKQPARFKYQRKSQKQSTQAYQQKQMQQKAEQLGAKGKKAQQKQQQQRQAKLQRRSQKGFSEWSEEPMPDWNLEAELTLSSLTKQAIDARRVEMTDLHWRGTLRYYDRRNDRILPSRPIPVEPVPPNMEFYFTTTREDKAIGDELSKPDVHVAATDQILACLMAAPQSRYSWHVRLTKITEDECTKILFDKKDGSMIDYVTVHETAADPPAPEDEVKINRPEPLSIEASKLNLDISQQLLLRSSPPAEIFHSPTFVDEEGTLADRAYRYRRIKLPGRERQAGDDKARRPITIVTRADVDAKLQGSESNGYVAIRTLNEFKTLNKPWKSELEVHKGALLATEIRNNAGKFARWVAQSIISGAETLKLVYVSRISPMDNAKHVVLNVQTFNTNELGTQMGLTPDIGWGSVRSIIDVIMGKEDGDFTLIKDPLKATLRLYRLPETADKEE